MGFNLTTFLFEVINFVVLVWLLSRILYRPLRRSIDRRQAEERERRELLETREQALATSRQDYDDRVAKLAVLRDDVMREATEQAEKERARLLAQARDDASAERARGQRLLEAEREAAANWVREIAVERSTEAAGQMLVELAPEAVDLALFKRLLVELERRPEVVREALSADPDKMPDLEVTGAKLPPTSQADELKAKVSELLGRTPGVTLREDPSLIAGLVLRVGDRVFDASVAGQLALFRERARELLDEPGHD